MKTVLNDNATVAHYWAHQRQSEGRTSSGNMSFNGPVLYSYRLPIGRLVEHRGQTIVLCILKGPTATTNGQHLPAMRGAASHMRTLPVVSVPDGAITATWAEEELRRAVDAIKKEHTKIARKRKGLEWAIPHYEEYTCPQKRRLIDFVREQVMLGHVVTTPDIDGPLAELESLLPLPDLDVLKEKAKATAAKERQAKKAQEAKDKALFDDSLDLWKANETTHLRRYGRYPEVTYLRLQGSPVFVETSKGVAIDREEAKQAYIAFKKGRLLGQKLAGYTITQIDNNRKVVIAGCHTVPFAEIEEIGCKL